MATDEFKITLHMVSSLDGYVAKKDNSVSWFETSDNYQNSVSMSEKDRENFLESIDCYVMGARTYEHALELSQSYGWAYGDVPTIVLTHQKLIASRPNIETYSGDLDTLVHDLLKPNYKRVWVVGGPRVIKDFIRLKLADEIIQSILPVLLGEGVPFFDSIGKEQALHLKNVVAYNNAMVELAYEFKK